MTWLLVFFLLFTAFSVPLKAAEIAEIPLELMELIPETLEPQNIKKMLDNPSPKNILQSLWQYLWKEVRLHTRLIGQVIIVAVLAAIFKEIAESFSKEAGEVGFLAAYLVLILFLVASLKEMANLTIGTVVLLSNIVKVLVPIVASMVALGGEFSTTLTLSPIIIGLGASVSLIVEKVIMPMALASGVVGLASYVSKRPMLTRLSGFFRWLCLLILGLVNTVFFGLITSLGLGSAAQDSLAYRTAKYVINTVPIVGSAVANSTDLLQASTKAVQSFASGVGLLFLLFATLYPVLKLCALILVYKLLQAVVEPVAETRFLGALESMEKSVTLFLSLIIITAVMFYLSVGVLAGIGAFLLR
ncbi:MAG TPA: hypothetical protein GX522_03140 [Firmicutes bacterium]|jgi:stage III sporulation protein AE|nr:hypothetical protein [Bacillota bacterium]